MKSERPRVFYGWWVTLTAALGLFWGPPLTVYSFSTFFKPLMQDFHTSRTAISMAFTFHNILGAAGAPLAGWLIDRYGARKVILLASTLFGATLVSVAGFSTSLWRLYIIYMVLGFLVSGVGPIPYGKVVSHWFDRYRGLALGLTMLGIGLGALIMPSLAQQLIAKFGWRGAYVILGCAVLLIALPTVATFLKEKPEQLGLLPDGAERADIAAPQETDSAGLSWHDAWHSPTFWLMVGAFFLVSASVQGCVLHMTAMLTDRGITLQTAILASSLVGAAVLSGRVGSGYLLDRFFAPYLAVFFFGSVAIGIGLLRMGGSPALAFLGAFLVGMGLGAEVDLIAYLTSRYFGLRCFGTIYGAAFCAFVLAGALGPLVMGAGFDLTGSYKLPLTIFFAASLIAVALMTRLGPYRYGAPQTEDIKPPLQIPAEDQI